MRRASVTMAEVAVMTGVVGATGMVAIVRRALAGGVGYSEEGSEWAVGTPVGQVSTGGHRGDGRSQALVVGCTLRPDWNVRGLLHSRTWSQEHYAVKESLNH